MARLPSHVLGGRLRTSTLLLVAAFLVVLTLWLFVRPEPVSGSGSSGAGSAGSGGVVLHPSAIPSGL